MRRTYISPEFYNRGTYGTLNHKEVSNFFGSNLLKIEDSIEINNQDIIYYQKVNGEQLDFDIESTINEIVYSTTIDKKDNHTIVIDESQSNVQLEGKTKWNIDINLNKILYNYIYSNVKRYRTFEGIQNNMVYNNSVNIFIKNYINDNIINKYRYKSIDLYIKYNDLRGSYLKFNNKWNPNIESSNNIFNKFETNSSIMSGKIRLLFSQERLSSEYSFDYYFNINFERI